MTGSAAENHSHVRGVKAAALAGLLAPIAWAAVVVVELARANIGRSLISRPERFFSDPTWHWPIVFLVGVMVLAELAAGVTLALSGGRRWSRPAGFAALLLGVALGARFATAWLLPSDAHGYTVSAQAALSANLTVAGLPAAMLVMAVLVRRRGPGLAWLSAGMAIAMLSIAAWAMAWAARTGASQPQLLALEPVAGLAAAWSAAVGAWLLGWPSSLRTDVRWPALPPPGRKAFLALAMAAIVGSPSSRIFWPERAVSEK